MAYAFACCVSLIFSFVFECFSKPKPRLFFKRKKQAMFVTGLLVFSLFLFALLLTLRPYFAASLSLLGIVVVVVINNTKFKTLREPLVFSDFFLYLQAIKHPRLYLPFLGIYPLLGLILSVCLIGFFGFYLEEPKHQLLSWTSFIIGILFIASVISLRVISKKIVITNDLSVDCKELGVLAALCAYGAQASEQRKQLATAIQKHTSFSSDRDMSDMVSPVGLADIVVVQSESFFDARQLGGNIKEDTLAEYDECLLKSYLHGQLQVPAWGANTMRTEFAFLTGLESQLLGTAQYYPYQQLAEMQIPSIVNELKSQGYWCVCIHPNDASFFMRDVFFNKLGFDEFVDAEEFIEAERQGPYVADLEVSKKIEEILNKTEQPCFIFAITMENHGPLHLESVSKQEWQKYYEKKPSPELNDLSVYLRHLKNADVMIQRLLAHFDERPRNTVFGFYGDHVPAIPDVFEAHGYDDPKSNYFIWSDACYVHHKAATRKVESLAKEIVNLAKEVSKA